MDLYTKQIDDKYIRDNFERIEETLNNLVFNQGDFEFFEFRVEGEQDAYKLYHNLGFNPNDVIVTKAIGSAYQFNYNGFNDQYLTVETSGDLYLRCIIGNLRGDEVTGENAFAAITDDLGSSGGGSGGGVDVLTLDDIVDNLTTGGSTSVLSAQQGLVLKGLIDNINSTITDPEFHPWRKITVNALSSSATVIDTISVGTFNTAKYILNITNNTTNKTKSMEMLVSNENGTICDIVYSRIGEGIDMGVGAVNSAGNMQLIVNNNEANDINVKIGRLYT